MVQGILNGPGYKIIPGTNGFLETRIDSVGKIRLITGKFFSGNFVNDQCTQCTVIEYRRNSEKGAMRADYIPEQLLTGWVIKDFEEHQGTGKLKSVAAYRALYVGDVELFRFPGESGSIKTVDLKDNNTYIGEVDSDGKPFGFGSMTLYGSKDWVYTGFVDNGKPEWGYIELRNNPLQPIIGGYFRNGVIMRGVIMKREVNQWVVIRFSDIDGGDPGYNTQFYDIRNGTYTRTTYSLSSVNRWYSVRTESGTKINGYEKDIWVSKGLTEAEKRKQRKPIDGMIRFSDLTIGDIVVVDGMASPVIQEVGGVYYLKNSKRASSISSSLVRLSRHGAEEFHTSCKRCSGSGQITYSFQRPPEEVTIYSTRFETEVLDYTIVHKTISEPRTYTKTFAPEKRVKNCDECAGKGYALDVTEIAE